MNKEYYYFSDKDIKNARTIKLSYFDKNDYITINEGNAKKIYSSMLYNISGNPYYNYAYQFNNLRLFELNKNNILYYIRKGIIDQKKFLKYYGKKEINEVNFDSIHIDAYTNYTDINKLKQYFDGFINYSYFNKNSAVYVFHDIAIKKAKLVDGNIIRFKKNFSEIKLDFPDNVLNDLVRYTEQAGWRLKPDTKDWLRTNFKAYLPYKSVELYRGTAYDVEEDYHISNLKKILGIEIDLIKKGTNVIINRKKESSWTYDPEIARIFFSGMASDDIDILFKAIIDKEDILIDFTRIPQKYKHLFEYINQNEVIVESKKIKAKIASVNYVSKNVEKILQNRGLKFKKYLGVF